jgi:hypothetical protein
MTKPARSLPILLAAMLCALPLQAQSWDVVQGLRAGDRIKVAETGGKEHKGAVSSVTPDAISLTTGKAQVIVDRPRVKRIQLHSASRRARNVAIGAGIGVAVGVTIDQTLGAYLRNETGDEGRPIMYLAPIGLFGGIGALMSPYRTIYRVK